MSMEAENLWEIIEPLSNIILCYKHIGEVTIIFI